MNARVVRGLRMARAANLVMALLAAAVLAQPAQGAEKLSAATERLFDAVWSDDLAAVRGAIAGGADVGAVNEFGVRAVDMAVDKGHYDIAHYLLSVDQLRRETEGTNSAPAEPTPRQRVEQRTVTTASLAPAPINPPADPPKTGTSAGWLIAAETPAPTPPVVHTPNIVAGAAPVAPAPPPALPAKSAAESLWSPGGTGESNAAPKLRVASVAEPRQIAPTPEPESKPEIPAAKVEGPTAAPAATVKLGAEESAADKGASGWLGRITEALNISKLTGTADTDAAPNSAPETTSVMSTTPGTEAATAPDPTPTPNATPEPTPAPVPNSPTVSAVDPQPEDNPPGLLDTLSNLFSPDADARIANAAEANAQSDVPGDSSPVAATASPAQSSISVKTPEVAPEPEPKPVTAVEPLTDAPEPIPQAEKPGLFDTIGKLFAQDTSAEPSSELVSTESVGATTASEPAPDVIAQPAAAAPNPENAPVFEPSENVFGNESGVKVAEVATPRVLETPPPPAAEVSESTAAATPVDPPAAAPADPPSAEPAPDLLDTISNLFRAESSAGALSEATTDAAPEVVAIPASENVKDTEDETAVAESKAPPPSATWTELSSYPLAPNTPPAAETTSSEIASTETASTETASSSAVPSEETNQVNEAPVVTEEQPGLFDAIGDLFRSKDAADTAPEATPKITPEISAEGTTEAAPQPVLETAAVTEDSAPIAAETVSPPKIAEPTGVPESAAKSAAEPTPETAPEVVPKTTSESTSAINQQSATDEQPGLLDAIGNLFRADSTSRPVETVSVEASPLSESEAVSETASEAAPVSAPAPDPAPASELFAKSDNLFRNEGGVKIAEVAEPVSVPAPVDSPPVQPAAAPDPSPAPSLAEIAQAPALEASDPSPAVRTELPEADSQVAAIDAETLENTDTPSDTGRGFFERIGELFKSGDEVVAEPQLETPEIAVAPEPAPEPEQVTELALEPAAEPATDVPVSEPVTEAVTAPTSQTEPVSSPEPVSEVITDPLATKVTAAPENIEIAEVADTPTDAPVETIPEAKPGVFDQLSSWFSSATENSNAEPQPEPQPEAPSQVAEVPVVDRAASDQTIVQSADQTAAAGRVRKVAPPPEPRQKPFVPPVRDRLSAPPPSVAERPQIPLPGPIDANPATRPANADKPTQLAALPPKLVPTGPDEVGKRRARVADTGPILSNPARPPAPMLAAEPLSGVELKLGGATKLGAVLPASGPRRDLCVDKSRWNTMFCVEPVAWPAAVGAAFDVSTTYYRGQQAIVQYEGGLATQYHALFPVKGMKMITEHFRKLYGPPTEMPEIWTALIGQPQRPNRTLRWRSKNPKTSAEHILEIREIDDLRWSSPPDINHGVVRLYARDKGSVFELLSATDLLLVNIRRRS